MPLREEPAADDLLAIARDVLLNDLLPALPPDKALAARMVASAMAIAARAAAQDPLWEGAVEERLGDPRALAAAIREGRLDPGTEHHAQVRLLLLETTHLRCTVSAPRALG